MTRPTAACKACQTPLDPSASLGNTKGYECLPCERCGTVTVAPFPTPEELTAFYQSYTGSKIYKPKELKKIRRSRRRLQRLIGKAPGKRLLDVGCNCGFTVKAAMDLGLDAHGIDIDATAVASAQDSYGKDRFNAISVQELAKTGFKADVVHTSEVIEHVPDPDGFAAAIGAILNPGGILFLTTPDAGHWNRPRLFTAWPEVKPPSHIVFFTKEGLRQLFAKHGLRNIRFRRTLKPGIRMTGKKAMLALCLWMTEAVPAAQAALLPIY